MKDLNSQQIHLSSTSYDLRISNLAKFIYKRVINCESGMVNKSFLDVGAGNGMILKYFKQKGYKVSGFELEKANVNNMKRDPQLSQEKIEQGDITKLSGNQEYDIVLASDVIEHVENDNLAIKNLWSFVKTNGLLVITVPAHSCLYGKRDKIWGHYRRYDNSYLILNLKSLRSSELVFSTQWNFLGLLIYFIYEKILKKPINEKMRYDKSIFSRFIRQIFEVFFSLEYLIGGVPLGLTLVVGVRKVK